MKFNTINIKGLAAVALAAVSQAFVACNDYMEGVSWPITTEPQLDEVIAEDPDLSLFYEVIKQGDAIGLVHSYGTYTLFVPNNEAVENYLGVQSETEALSAISNLTTDSARFIVKYHMLSDTIHTSDLVNSRLSCANMNADYLTSKYLFDATSGENYYAINRNARIVKNDIHTGNGILHVVNGFLSRPSYKVQDVFENIDAYTEGQTILPKLMKEILACDTLEINLNEVLGNETYYTFLSQTDSVMEAEGLTSVDALVDALQKNNISNYSVQTLLSNWIGYHFLKGRYYMSDIRSSSSMNTCTSLKKVITVSTILDDIYLNRFEAFDEPGIPMVQEGQMVDFTCANGVVQTIGDELEIIERAATRINWDMGEQPEIQALKGFRKAGTKQYFNSTLSADENGYVKTDLSMMSWSGKNNPVVLYECDYEPKLGQMNFDVKSEYVYGDFLNFRMGTTVVQYMEIKTPTLVTGKYKVWLRYRAMGTYSKGNGTIRTTFKQDGEEDQVFGTVVLSKYGSAANNQSDDESQVAKGFQQPQAYYPNQTYVSACLLGTIDVKKDGVHTLRFDPTETNQSLGQNYDMLMFIPIELDQVLPRVQIDGTDARIYKTVVDEAGNRTLDKSVYYDVSGYNSNYRTHIFPYKCPVETGELGEGECPYSWCPNHDPNKFDAEGNLIGAE